GLRKECPEIWLSVSVTTRPPRPGEADGREYYFVGDPDFDRMVAGGELLEWAAFAGYRYGTPRAPLAGKLAAGIPSLLEIDLAGARQVRRAVPDALLVFLAPPSWPELVRRLTGRGTAPPGVSALGLAAGPCHRASRGNRAQAGGGPGGTGRRGRVRRDADQHVGPGLVPSACSLEH